MLLLQQRSVIISWDNLDFFVCYNLFHTKNEELSKKLNVYTNIHAGTRKQNFWNGTFRGDFPR